MFDDRAQAGRMLAAQLRDRDPATVVVLGVPRGGVPVAAEVARELGAPLDVVVVRKLGLPYQPEVAMGALGEGEVRIVDEEFVRHAHVSPHEVALVEAQERAALAARARYLRDGRAPLSLRGRVGVVVDDGIARGATARAAVLVARQRGAARVVVATPVAPARMTAALLGADELVAVERPQLFRAVGQLYRDFNAVSDDEVAALLAEGRRPRPRRREVLVRAGPTTLAATVTTPATPRGVVLFAHGSGSSRRSPRNRYVAEVLVAAGFATVLLDLLTPDEEGDPAAVFDVPTLARRLVEATAWARRQPWSTGRVGYFGASTGAAAALVAAAELDGSVDALVARGGRPDLAREALARVTAPALLLVGGADPRVLELNREAASRLGGECRVEVVPGATHLFEEPGALEQVARAASAWFADHLATDDATAGRTESELETEPSGP